MVFSLDEVLKHFGFQLNEMQSKAVLEGMLDAHNCLVCAPTASGKTLLAVLKILREKAYFSGNLFKAIYVVPLKALAEEKFEEFTKTFEPYSLTVGISVGNFDSDDSDLFEKNIIIVTSEKMDSILRHRKDFLASISLAIFDEFHLINDETRGATLEVIVTKFLRANCKILGLSATIANPEEVSSWLKAKLIKSSFRPTKLVKGIMAGGKLHLGEKSFSFDDKKPLEDLIGKILSEKKQALVFTATRRTAESTAQALSSVVPKFLDENEMQNLLEHSKKSLKALSNPTSQCKDLSKCFEKGIVFHHAGLLSKQQSEIRKAFKDDRSLKIIVCTTTLAMGIDFPASYVVVRDLKRFDGNFSSFMPQSEIAQICGRAGRPRYDKEGYAVLMCSPKDEGEVDDLYLNDKVEDLYSKLSSLPFLRIHSLAAIASGYCASFEELFQFFNSTLFAFQFKNNERFLVEIERAVFELKDLDFVREKSGKLVATPIGERVSELYIDPKTAAVFLEFLNDKRMEKKEFSSIGALFVLCKSSEMRPLLNVKKTEEDALFNEAWDLDLDDTDLAEKMKTAKLLDFWTNEKTEEEILEHFSMPPGIVHGKVKIAEWLLYSLQEMAFVLNESTKYEQLKNLRRRVKHGIKEELLGLCKIRGIGRVRARKLFNAGIKTIEDYHLQPKEKIKEIILGKKSHQETLDLG